MHKAKKYYEANGEPWPWPKTKPGQPGFTQYAYSRGWLMARHPVPALLMDSESNLAKRWSNWMDHPDNTKRY
jgi:hypothetical protein